MSDIAKTAFNRWMLIFTMLTAVSSGLWAVVLTPQKVEAGEKQMEIMRQDINVLKQERETLARVEERVKGIADTVKAMDERVREIQIRQYEKK